MTSNAFIGDPHKDAQALAYELSAKLAKSAKELHGVGGSRRIPKQQNCRADRNIKSDKVPTRGTSKKMTAEDAMYVRNDETLGIDEPLKSAIGRRVKPVEQAFDGSMTGALSGELRKEGLIKELKARGRLPRDAEKELEEIPRSDERWDVGPARREHLARRVIEERRPSISSLSQLLGNHNGSGRSDNFLGMLEDEERRSNLVGESLFETDEDELSPMEREMMRPKPATLNPASPLHLGSLSRGKQDLKKSKPELRHGWRNIPSGERSAYSAHPSIRKAATNSMDFMDDDLDVSELPLENGCGLSWDWSRNHKYSDEAFYDLTGLTCAVSESRRRPEIDSLLAEQSTPAKKSVSSLNSEANSLPILSGDGTRKHDLAGYNVDTGRTREISGELGGLEGCRSTFQGAIEDIPGVGTASTSRLKEQVPPEEHRTLSQKYRPKNFTEIVGQPVVVKSLSIAIIKDKIAPVYLLMGPRGTGKTSAARMFAAGLNCESLNSANRPCGICRQCSLNQSADLRQIEAVSSMDMVSMKAMMGSFIPHARYKVIVVEGCDLLGIDMWNAFLTLLEEPPRNVVFILITTDAERLPPTATSRCQKFHFSKVSEPDIVRRLKLLAEKEGLHFEAEALSLIASKSDGSLRDAEIFLDQVCLLDRTVTVALVREVGGLLPDNQNLDLLDYALSADTVNIIKTMRKVLASGVEPLGLVSLLGALITDILAGSLDVNRGRRRDGSFFNRNISAKEEQQRLREALKVLAEAEKQLRAATDKATWLTAALLQFAPDRSFVPSEANNSVAQSPTVAPINAIYRAEQPVMNKPEHQNQVPVSAVVGQSLEANVEKEKRPPEVPEDHEIPVSEQTFEEDWGRKPAEQQGFEELQLAETSKPLRHEPETTLDFQVFGEEILARLWNRVLSEITSRSLRQLLHTDARLVAAGAAIDGSRAIVALEFDHPRDKHKAERSWRSICIAFQAVLNTAVELRIGLCEVAPGDGSLARAGETMVGTKPGTSTQHKNSEIVTEDSSSESYSQSGPSTQGQYRNKWVTDEDPISYDAHLQDMQEARSRSHRRRTTRPRRHRQARDVADTQLQIQQNSDPSAITPRRPPPSRRRRVKRTGSARASSGATQTVIPVRETKVGSRDSGSFGDVGGDILAYRGKKQLSTMVEEPLSEIEDLQSAQRKISQQRADSSLSANFDRRTNIVYAERGSQRGSPLCCRRASPQPEFLMRKSRVKTMKKGRGKALLLKLIPCAESRVAKNTAPVSKAP